MELCSTVLLSYLTLSASVQYALARLRRVDLVSASDQSACLAIRAAVLLFATAVLLAQAAEEYGNTFLRNRLDCIFQLFPLHSPTSLPGAFHLLLLLPDETIPSSVAKVPPVFIILAVVAAAANALLRLLLFLERRTNNNNMSSSSSSSSVDLGRSALQCLAVSSVMLSILGLVVLSLPFGQSAHSFARQCCLVSSCLALPFLVLARGERTRRFAIRFITGRREVFAATRGGGSRVAPVA